MSSRPESFNRRLSSIKKEDLSFWTERKESSGRKQKSVAPVDRQTVFDPSICDNEDRTVFRKILCTIKKIHRRLQPGAAAADHLNPARDLTRLYMNLHPHAVLGRVL